MRVHLVPSHVRALRFGALALSISIVSAIPVHAQEAVQLMYRLTGDASTTGSDPVEIGVKVFGEKMRMEVDFAALGAARGGSRGGDAGGMGNAMMRGAYAILQPGGKAAMVVPGMSMAIVMDPSMMGAGNPMGGMMGRGGPPPAEVEAAVNDVVDLGAGERILGYATRKYRAATKDGNVEMWIATDLGAVGTAIQKYTETFGSMFMGGSKAISNAYGTKLPKGGVMLKAITTGTSGRKTTIEVTDIKKTPADASEFEVPAGIQIMDPGALMQGMRGRGRGGN